MIRTLTTSDFISCSVHHPPSTLAVLRHAGTHSPCSLCTCCSCHLKCSFAGISFPSGPDIMSVLEASSCLPYLNCTTSFSIHLPCSMILLHNTHSLLSCLTPSEYKHPWAGSSPYFIYYCILESWLAHNRSSIKKTLLNEYMNEWMNESWHSMV